jgi:hypothetical protein
MRKHETNPRSLSNFHNASTSGCSTVQETPRIFAARVRRNFFSPKRLKVGALKTLENIGFLANQLSVNFHTALPLGLRSLEICRAKASSLHLTATESWRIDRRRLAAGGDKLGSHPSLSPSKLPNITSRSPKIRARCTSDCRWRGYCI